MTIVIVLGLISITLALSYAMMRTQGTTSQIQSNLNHRADARQAAIAGLTIALRKMRLADWGGAESALTGSLGDDVSYTVTYETGDPNLLPSDDDYGEYPYRVTVKSTGIVTDPADPNRRTMHTVQAVAQLLRQRLVATPGNWTSAQQLNADTPYTVHQWSDAELPMQFPVQVKGPVRLQGSVKMCQEYPPHDDRVFNGRIDEVAIFNRALSSSQISSLYAAGLAGNNALPAAYASAGPSHWWRLNDAAGSLTATPSAGGYTGVYTGATAGSNGVNNLAARFNGYNSHIALGNIDVSGTDLTIVAWFRADSFSTQSDARIISKAVGTEVQDHYWMLGTCKVGSSTRLRFRLRTLGYTSTLEANSGNLTTGNWIFAAAVYDGLTMKLYHNGSSVGSSFKLGTLSTSSSTPVWIGDNPPGSIVSRYLRDLNAERLAGREDNRPLTGPVYMPMGRTDAMNRSRLNDLLGLATHDIAESNSAPLNHPGSVSRYRLYPGGKEYSVETLPNTLINATYEPNPLTNPLGLFRNSGNVTIDDNVTVRGTIVTAGSGADIYLAGQNVQLLANDLPSLYGDATVRQLPVAIVADDFRLLEFGEATIRGLAIAWDEFDVQRGTHAARLDYQGRLLAKEMKLAGRYEWMLSTSIWQTIFNSFISQSGYGNSYFPHWLDQSSQLDEKPTLTISPESREVTYHWHDWSQPFFPADPNNGTLQWDLISWTDDP